MKTERLPIPEAEQMAKDWAANFARRDPMVRTVKAAGLSKTRIHELTGIARTTIDRILKETPMVTEIIATVPKKASRATAAETWRTMATDQGLHIEIVGKTTDGTPVIEYQTEQYALVQEGTDVWPVPLRCSICSTGPGSLSGETFRFSHIDPETDEAEIMCGTCWARYGPES
jgi:hypothetical protein